MTTKMVFDPDLGSISTETKWILVRRMRGFLLASSDWTVLPDSPLPEAKRQSWLDYRQQLRDTPSSFSSPDDVEWPDPPS